MFVSRILDWYLGEVQEGLKSGDWAKADEVVGMIGTYQQAKNKTLDISPKRMQAELKYNKMDVFRYCKIGYLVLGGLLLVLSFVMLFRRSRWMKVALWLLGIGVLVVFHYHMFGMGMRWYIGGYAPWSNSYETMVYVGWGDCPCRPVVRAPQYDHLRAGHPVRRYHPLRLRPELDGP